MADQQRRDDRNAETTRADDDDTNGGKGRKDEVDAPGIADVPSEGELGAHKSSRRRKSVEGGVQKIDLSSGSE